MDHIYDIIYVSTGTHWIFEIVRMLQQGKTELPVIEKDDFMIEMDVTDIASFPSPRILSTHVLLRQIPTLLQR